MTTKLIQKQFLKGTREFEIVEDAVNVRIKTPFKEEKLTVVLTILNPEPVVNKPFLEFHSRVKCGPLIELWLDNPNPAEFNAFVETLKQLAQREFNAFAGLNPGSSGQPLPGNVYEEPPEFDEPGQVTVKSNGRSVDATAVGVAIEMLQSQVTGDEIKPVLAALESLKAEPDNEAHLVSLVDAFNKLGILQGAVLTYAPYVSVLLSDDPFGED